MASYRFLVIIIATAVSADAEDTYITTSPSTVVSEEKGILLPRIGDGAEDTVLLLTSAEGDGPLESKESGEKRVLITVVMPQELEDSQEELESLIERLNDDLYCNFISEIAFRSIFNPNGYIEKDFEVSIVNVNSQAVTNTILEEYPGASNNSMQMQQTIGSQNSSEEEKESNENQEEKFTEKPEENPIPTYN